MIRILIFVLSVSSVSALGADAVPVVRTNITGGDEAHIADVILDAGKKKLRVEADVSISSTNFQGFDNVADTWVEITACPNGSSLNVGIAAGASGGAVSVTSNFTATEGGDLVKCADLVCTDLTADATFAASFECMRVTDNPIVHISSIFFDGYGQRPTNGDFVTTPATGATATDGFDNIITREKLAAMGRNVDDKRYLDTFTVSGQVSTVPGGIGDLIIENFEDAGASPDMRVDGSTTPVEFDVDCLATKSKLINEIRVFGGCNGIKFGQHLCKNTILTNGIKVEVRSEAETLALPIIKTTEDWKNKFSFGPGGPGGNFRIDVQSGADQFVAVFSFGNPAVIRPCGTLPGPDDFMRITIQDDLTGSAGGNLNELASIVAGFKQ